MMQFKNNNRFIISSNGARKSCFPVGLNTAYFVDITCVSDEWQKYLDTNTGKVHDCAEYYKMYLETLVYE